MFEVITGELRAKLLIAHVGPLTRAWAAPLTLSIAGLRAVSRVDTRNSGFTCEQHTTTDTGVPKTQATSPLAARFQRFSPRWSAVWAPYHLEQRPRRHQSGGIAPSKAATRRQHAPAALRMAQTPTATNLKCASSAPRHLQDRRKAGWREVIRPTPPLQWHFREKVRPARPLQWLFREKVLPARVKTPNLGQFERTGRIISRFHDLPATQGELFRACSRRPSSALPISDPAPPV